MGTRSICSGTRSTLYIPRATDLIGTPGTSGPRYSWESVGLRDYRAYENNPKGIDLLFAAVVWLGCMLSVTVFLGTRCIRARLLPQSMSN